MEHSDLVRDLLKAAGQFHDRQLWKRFTNADCVGVRIPSRQVSFLGIVMGQGGQEYGLSLFRGPTAADCVAAMTSPEGSGDDARSDMDLLGFSMDRFADLPAAGKELIRQAGIYPQHDQLIPHFIAKPPGCQPHLPQDADLELLLLVLQGLVEADQQLKPARLDARDGIWVLTLGGPPETVSVAREPWPRSEVAHRFPAAVADLRDLPHLKTTWLAGLLPMPAGVDGDDREPWLLLVAEVEAGGQGGRVLHALPVMPDQFNHALHGMVDIFCGHGPHGEQGLPRKILCSSRKLCLALTGILAPLGVQCVYEPQLPPPQEIAADLFNHMDEALAADNRKRRPARAAPLPAPDDLAGWKQVDQELAGRFADYLDQAALRSSRAATRYFGDDDLQHYFEQHRQRAVIMAYTGWGVVHYRATKNGKTYAEKLLARGLPEAQAVLLRARLESYPSLYRVASHDPKTGTIDLEDVLLGGSVTIQDRMMSENIEDGLFLVARVFPAGQFHFLDPAGPPLGMGMGSEAVEFLQESGLKFTPEELRQDAHLFGRLWDWSDQWQSRFQSMRLVNMDGDELLWHTASFSVTDPVGTRHALRARKDIEAAEGDEFLWIQKTGRAAKTMGGPVHLGRIELLGDELVLTVNSAQRLAKARRWIEELPGVAFRNVTTRRMNEAEEDRPLDERIARPEPVEITPELAVALQEMINKQYMAWLDTALPVLKGQTPRQACQTAAGRQQVTMLIRTTADPMGPAPFHVPPQAMLRALGLEDQPSASALAPPLPRATPFSPISSKIGRNDPCPCGSGKKYKKCCLRQ